MRVRGGRARRRAFPLALATLPFDEASGRKRGGGLLCPIPLVVFTKRDARFIVYDTARIYNKHIDIPPRPAASLLGGRRPRRPPRLRGRRWFFHHSFAPSSLLARGRRDRDRRVLPEPIQRLPRLDHLPRLLHQPLHVVLRPVPLELLLGADHLGFKLLLRDLDVLKAEQLLARDGPSHDEFDGLLVCSKVLVHHFRRRELVDHVHGHLLADLRLQHLFRVHLPPRLFHDGRGQRGVADGRERVHERLVRRLLEHRLRVLLLRLENLLFRLRDGRRVRVNLRRDVIRGVGDGVFEHLAQVHREVRGDAAQERLRPVVRHRDRERALLPQFHPDDSVDQTREVHPRRARVQAELLLLDPVDGRPRLRVDRLEVHDRLVANLEPAVHDDAHRAQPAQPRVEDGLRLERVRLVVARRGDRHGQLAVVPGPLDRGDDLDGH
eukprot:31566-Pelagococcus_subviridis.AAC.11